MRLIRKSLILIHRYLGIVLSLLFTVWFLSGIGMIYSRGMPSLSPESRLLRAPAIDLAQLRLTPIEAAAQLTQSGAPRVGRVFVGTMLGRPIYRLGGRGGSSMVFADDGSVLDGVDTDMAKRIASHFLNVPEERLHQTLIDEPDQWTIGERQSLPLHKITVDDDARTELYISAESGDIPVLTTRGSRALAWVSAIPHWLYFTSLRNQQRLWRQVVLWTSGTGCVLALLGIILGFTQFKWSRPLKLSRISSHIPYSGLMRWHYIAGAVFGVLTLTWVFSGLLSMEPWDWTSAPGLQGNLRGLLAGGAVNAEEFPRIDAAAWKKLLPGRAIKEIEYTKIQGEPYFAVRTNAAGSSEPDRVIIAAKTLEIRTAPFSVESLMSRVKQAYPNAPVLEFKLLTGYDSYYYSNDADRPLPVLRVKFDDPSKTWMYIDPRMSQVLGSLPRVRRLERWIYHGFHSLDFSFWYGNRPLWQSGMIVLNLGGAALSLLGAYLGFKRVVRGAIWGGGQTKKPGSDG